jgi:uncharacterized protein YjbI with pentapeptide repeats
MVLIRTTLGVAIAICIGSLAQADIFRWDTGGLIPGTAGITPGPGVNLSNFNTEARNLRFARFNVNGNLTNANFRSSWLNSADFPSTNLTNANFLDANLSNASLDGAILMGANLTEATIAGASLSNVTFRGFTPEQLYSTASYQQRDLRGITLDRNDLGGWNFSGQNLSDVRFRNTTFTNANIAGATIARAIFIDVTSRGFVKEQLYSTADYQQRDLSEIWLQENDLSGWDFSGQNLTSTNFTSSTLTNANFTGANIAGTFFNRTVGLTKEQFYSTANYQAKNLQGPWMQDLDLTGWDLRGQNLSGTQFGTSTLTDADLTGAIVTATSFGGYNGNGVITGGISLAQLYSTASYQQRNLQQIGLAGHDLSGADLSGQNLSGAAFGATDLTNADFTGAIVAGTGFHNAAAMGFTKEQLYSTESYQRKDIRGIGLGYSDLTGWDFAGQNLTRAAFGGSTLTGSDFTGAIVVGANFERADGFTEEQLYSTASYQQKDLRGFSVSHNDVSGWDFRGQNLTNADFDDAIYVDTDLSFADTRGGQFFELSMPVLRNTIEPDGIVAGLDLNDGERLVVGDYDGFSIEFSSWSIPAYPVHIREAMAMADGSFLKLAFEADEWNSTISFDPGISVELGGVLELSFTPDVNVASQVGRTFVAFDWTEVTPTGEFQIDSPYVWDTSKLYITGEITLQAVPEPASALLLLAAMPGVFAARRFLAVRCRILRRAT